MLYSNYILFEFGVFGKRLPASSLPFLHGRRRIAAMQAAHWRVGSGLQLNRHVSVGRGAGLRSVASVDWPPRRGGRLVEMTVMENTCGGRVSPNLGKPLAGVEVSHIATSSATEVANISIYIQ
jgi:hypothetical protein